MSPFIVIAQVSATPKNESQIEAALLDLAGQTSSEDGCVQYQMCREMSEEAVWVIFEVWETEVHWRAHLKADHLIAFKALLASTGGALTARKFTSLEVA